MGIAGIILAASSVLAAIAAIVVIARTLVANAAIPRVRDGDRLPPAAGLLSIVVPAHDEERVIEESVRTLRRQTRRNFEAIYVLDRCGDRTLERLRAAAEGDARIRAIENASCPPEWAGKCNACRIGAEAAQGEWILFTDADCRFDPGMIDAMLAIAADRRTALLTALGRLTFRRRFERVLQPVAAAVLFRLFPIEKANRAERRWPFANGQFLLFRRADYDAIGGHAAVKDALLEDLAFAALVHRSGRPMGVIDATRRMEVSMYADVAAMRAGWTRIYIEGCGRSPRLLSRAAVELVVVSVLLPLSAAVAAAAGIAGAVAGRDGAPLVAGLGLGALACGFTAVALIHQRQRAPILAALAHPLAALVVASWLRDGARMLRRRLPIRWGGREYVLEPR